MVRGEHTHGAGVRPDLGSSSSVTDLARRVVYHAPRGDAMPSRAATLALLQPTRPSAPAVIRRREYSSCGRGRRGPRTVA